MHISYLKHTKSIEQFAIFSVILWTILIASSAAWNIYLIKAHAEYLAEVEARANWNKDLAFRNWATRHGGVYVKPDKRTPPNPYLSHLENRDITTTNGTQLTLMNPAYMMRQMTQENEELYGIKGRITGQILLNPDNKPDEWELSTLQKFEHGTSEVIDLSTINGKPYLRFMKPLVTEQGCLKCHGHLGFKVGDIRGGVSISIPLTPYLQSAEKNHNFILMSHLFIWAVGLFSIVFLQSILRKKMLTQYEIDLALQKKEKKEEIEKDALLFTLQKRDKQLVIEKNKAEEMNIELTELNKTVAETSRSAAMTEVANGVLHNIGNILNSLNISVSLMNEKTRKTSLKHFEQTIGLMEDNKNDLDNYIKNDPKGQQVLKFLHLLSQNMNQEKDEINNDLSNVTRDIEHMKNIITVQQNYAGNYGGNEVTNISELVDDAINMQLYNIADYNICITKQYDTVPDIFSHRHNLLQIIINFISNSKHALISNNSESREITISISKNSDNISIEVMDNGIGIDKPTLDKIFNYGFTTKENGHGFGLHHSFKMASELGYTLRASSDGIGKGACFSLLIPIEKND